MERSKDRLFVRDGWRHYRRSYSLTEARWGGVVLAVLVAIAVWLGWKGAHPDSDRLANPQLAARRPIADRGPMPTDLAASGWTEGSLSQFDADNLYVKINGRADYFLAYGFQRLHFVVLSHQEQTVDVEMYDLGTPANALGAFGGERKDKSEAQEKAGGMSHVSRNALFVARGRFYVRAIGSDESEPVQAQLKHLEAVLFSQLEGETLPWAYDLFAEKLGIATARISYRRENAFSFGFARDVYSAKLEDDTQLFVVALASESAAQELAKKFRDGFLSYGEKMPSDDDLGWAKDQYIGALSVALPHKRWVLGVRGAPTLQAGRSALKRLRDGFAALPQEILGRAVPTLQEENEVEVIDER